MATDRNTALRKAEKLLRQGRLDSAIAEYVQLVQEQPLDLTTANTLGDLYVRAGLTEQAVGQYARIAAHLDREGFLPKAAALYKKILKVEPDNEDALLRAADIAARQGLLADAKAALNAVAARRLARGDRLGAAETRAQLGEIDPSDLDGRLAAARARVELGQPGVAAVLRGLAAELLEKDRSEDALAALREALAADPEDAGARGELIRLLLARGDTSGARGLAADGRGFRELGRVLEDCGDMDGALVLWAEALARDPEDAGLRLVLARAYANRGDWERAGEYLTPATAAGDRERELLAAEIALRMGRLDEGDTALRAIAGDGEAEMVGALGRRLATTAPEAAFRCTEIVADLAAERGEWTVAADAFAEFVERAPHHVPALMKLVELCVDGGLTDRVTAAQARLADAYLAAGSATEARAIAEDLLARQPGEPAHAERLRRALVLLGEDEPDRVIAARVQDSAGMTDSDLDLGQEARVPRPSVPSTSGASGNVGASAGAMGEAPPGPVEVPGQAGAPAGPARDGRTDSGTENAGRQFELSAGAIDITSILSEEELSGSGRADLHAGLDEIDLSGELERLIEPTAESAGPADLEEVFRALRDEEDRTPSSKTARSQYEQAVACEAGGRDDEAAKLLELAAWSPHLRFEAAGRLARLLARRAQWSRAVEWFERAAEAPAPTAEGSRELLYDLARTLEESGEQARALAVYLELQSEAGGYRDVADRIDRLSKSEIRG